MADEQHEGVVILALEATRKTSQTAEGYSGEQKNTVESVTKNRVQTIDGLQRRRNRLGWKRRVELVAAIWNVVEGSSLHPLRWTRGLSSTSVCAWPADGTVISESTRYINHATSPSRALPGFALLCIHSLLPTHHCCAV
jgi:hypothetical protein